jgi:hypothetical protein
MKIYGFTSLDKAKERAASLAGFPRIIKTGVIKSAGFYTVVADNFELSDSERYYPASTDCSDEKETLFVYEAMLSSRFKQPNMPDIYNPGEDE